MEPTLHAFSHKIMLFHSRSAYAGSHFNYFISVIEALIKAWMTAAETDWQQLAQLDSCQFGVQSKEIKFMQSLVKWRVIEDLLGK